MRDYRYAARITRALSVRGRMLTPAILPAVQSALRDAGLDGWLLFDFRGLNPIASGLLALEGMVSRRVFALIPAHGVPVAITHNIEQRAWAKWPAGWKRERYSTWSALEELLAKHVRDKRVAMEYSPGDAVPYLDRTPAGVLELVRAAGAKVVSSGELVTRFYATLTAEQIASHERAAAIVAQVGRDSISHAAAHARASNPLTEHELAGWIMERFARAGVSSDHSPIVAAGANAANPHYGPSATQPRHIETGDVLLVDLFAKEPGGVYGDQTWMGVMGTPTPRAAAVWEAVRDARDAAIAHVREHAASGRPFSGGDVDDAARRVVVERGFGEYFTHRTGHSIDARDLHGSGPHIDNFETREERLLIPGVAFSIEPGIYIEGEIGMRCEVNAYIGEHGATITPHEYQRELIVA
ncbi:MAG: aminopeptidase P family protein [Anaerolineae bacterium]|nr:aminopeptidase P family protein [Gemmatimonadaceae bacterium]